MTPTSLTHPLAADLDGILARAGADLSALAGARILLTGGTGFFGTWLVDALTWATSRAGADLRVAVMARNPGALPAHLVDAPGVELVAADVRRPPTGLGAFDAVIHAATPARASLNDGDPGEMLDIVVGGTRAVLDLAAASGPIPVLLTSSGAVYGRQPPGLRRVPEDHPGGPDPLSTRSAYAEGKRTAELLGAVAAERHGLAVKVARAFAFSGPGLPLDEHFALGNFVRDALAGGPVRILGDGTPVRSYLYGADLVCWLLAVLVRGETARAYNVGSEREVDVAGLAHVVAGVAAATLGRPRVAVEVVGTPVPGRLPERYVPDTSRARSELGVVESLDLAAGIARMCARPDPSPAR